MPERLGPEYGEFRAKLQFVTAAWMPYKIYEACMATGVLSNTAYCQIAICEKLARDLDLDLDELLANLPRRRTASMKLFDPAVPHPYGRPAKTPDPSNVRIAIARYGMGSSIDEEVR